MKLPIKSLGGAGGCGGACGLNSPLDVVPPIVVIGAVLCSLFPKESAGPSSVSERFSPKGDGASPWLEVGCSVFDAAAVGSKDDVSDLTAAGLNLSRPDGAAVVVGGPLGIELPGAVVDGSTDGALPVSGIGNMGFFDCGGLLCGVVVASGPPVAVVFEVVPVGFEALSMGFDLNNCPKVGGTVACAFGAELLSVIFVEAVPAAVAPELGPPNAGGAVWFADDIEVSPVGLKADANGLFAGCAADEPPKGESVRGS